MSSKNKIYFAKGFTIIELMIAVAILGFVVAFAVPLFSDFIERQRINSETIKIATAFKLARTEALSRGTEINVLWNANADGGADVTFTINGETITVSPGSMVVADTQSQDPDVVGSNLETIKQFTYRHDQLFIDEDDLDNRIDFSDQGRADALDIGVCNSDGDGEDSRVIRVSALGRVVDLDNDISTPIIDCT